MVSLLRWVSFFVCGLGAAIDLYFLVKLLVESVNRRRIGSSTPLIGALCYLLAYASGRAGGGVGLELTLVLMTTHVVLHGLIGLLWSRSRRG